MNNRVSYLLVCNPLSWVPSIWNSIYNSDGGFYAILFSLNQFDILCSSLLSTEIILLVAVGKTKIYYFPNR